MGSLFLLLCTKAVFAIIGLIVCYAFHELSRDTGEMWRLNRFDAAPLEFCWWRRLGLKLLRRDRKQDSNNRGDCEKTMLVLYVQQGKV